MKKKNWYKFMYIISGLLVAGFIIRLIADYIQYDPIATSFPFYASVLMRSIEFLLPSLIVFITAIIFKKFAKKN
ncbi:MAG TPA: hypothetical protein PK705_10405 [Clostridia bacterium]|nr:hypothetical protein [Clostridia bacterium]